MRRCLELALRAEGRTSPNPLVGAVVLDRAGQVVGEGYHHQAGLAHAEVNALDVAGERSLGGTLFVNLEPCCHFGRTPPCTAKVIASGVTKVVIGALDANPKVSGGGVAELKAAGIEVLFPLLEKECLFLNRGFIKAQTEQLPWLALKMALTLDGSIADRSGNSRYVSGEVARNFVMDLRDRFDCVLIGGNTARLDNPQLNVRDLSAERQCRNPLRAVLDGKCAIDPRARIFDAPGETIIFCLEEHLEKQKSYPSSCRLVPIASSSKDNQLDLRQALDYLMDAGAQKILCEGGGVLAGALIDQGYIDELYWIIAPKMLVDKEALRAVASPRTRLMTDTVHWKIESCRTLADDILLHCLSSRHEKFVI